MNEPTQPMQNPVVIGLKPDGCLRAAIWTHEMANQQRIPCWTFVSDGLASLGQKEVVFTVCRRQGEAPQNYPSGPLQWFELLYSLAQQGQIANDDYSLTQFTAPDFLGRKDIGMVVYTRPQGLGGLPPNALPGQYLQAIPFTQDEASVATRFGTLRVLSQLGRSVNYFPYPPWIDRDRKTVISPNDLSESMVAKCATVIVSGVHAVKEGDDIRLYVRPRASQNLANSLTKLPPHMPFAILTELFADSDSCMVWSNGQREPSAIGTSLNRTSLCFLIICPQQASSSLKLTEDGYACELCIAFFTSTTVSHEILSPFDRQGLGKDPCVDHVRPIVKATNHRRSFPFGDDARGIPQSRGRTAVHGIRRMDGIPSPESPTRRSARS